VKHKFSIETLQFLRDWLSWAESDTPKYSKEPRAEGEFSPMLGLCDNAPSGNVKSELGEAFSVEFPESHILPFNTRLSYLAENRSYANPERLAWVREQLS
jgi:hypothetical protein